MGCVEHQQRLMELLPEIDREYGVFEIGMNEFMKNPPTEPFPLFYLRLDSDNTVRPTIELCDALRGKTDDFWAKKPHETTLDEDLMRCVAINRFLSMKSIDPLANEGDHVFHDSPRYKFRTEKRETGGSDHGNTYILYVMLVPNSLV